MTTNNRNPIKRDLIIAHWNANGISSKRSEVMNFLAENKIDIFLVNGTRLTSKHKCKIPGYKSFRRDRSGNVAAGGLAIYCAHDIACSEVEYNVNSCEAHGIRLANNLTIITTYVRPQNKIDSKELQMLMNTSAKVILAGALNAKHQTWNCHNSNKNGKVIHKFINNGPYAIKAPDSHTLYPYSNILPSTVDIALIKNITNFRSIEAINDLDSDHHPIIITLSKTEITVTRRKFLNYKNADWDKYINYITEHLNMEYKLPDKESINHAVATLTKTINDAAAAAIPLITTRTRPIKLPEEILLELSNRNKIRRVYQKTRKRPYKILLNYFNKKILKMIFSVTNERLEKKVKSLSAKDNSIWSMTKALTNENTDNIPTLHADTGLVFSDKDKAEALARNFEKVHYLTLNLGDEATEILTCDTYRHIKRKQIDTDTIQLVTPREVQQAIKYTKPKKAPGNDNIQNILLKNLPKRGVVQLHYIINASCRLSYFPLAWKHATVLAFKKPGKDKLFPQNYRPISLLPTMTKIFELIILNRLNAHETVNNQLLEEQFGFQEKRSTLHQLARVTNDISTEFNLNRSTALVLLDIEKAFDTVWHKGLLHKLHNSKIPLYITKVLQQYLKNRTFSVKVNSASSGKKSIAAGVPQGSILGPRLFLYYLNDIPRNDKTKLALFADDTAIYAASWRKTIAIKHVQGHLDKLSKYYKKWKIKINATKTELVIFSKKSKKENNGYLNIKIDGAIIEKKASAKYLGMHLDNRLNFNKHILETKNEVHKATSILHPIIGQRSTLSYGYKSVLSIWSGATAAQLGKLQIVQNKILRRISRCNFKIKNLEVQRKYEIDDLKKYIFTMTKDFYGNIRKLPILVGIHCYKKGSAPFKMKHKMPYHILT